MKNASDPDRNVCAVTVDFRLYLITDRKVAKKPLPEAVREALEGGVKAVQLREKDLPVRELLALARDLRNMTIDFGAKLFINDQVDVAVSVAADGVQLGRESMPVAAARKVAGPKMLIGVSTHSVEEVLAAQRDGADFVVLGPIYETPSKAAYGAPIGLDPLRMAKRKADIPLFAVGGIKGRNIGHVLWAGAYGVAMISGILGAEDVRKAAKNTTEMITIVDRSICVQCGRR
jgi:thiamine-phosphate pyrophosphorylase